MNLIVKNAKMPLSCASCFAYDDGEATNGTFCSSIVDAPIRFPKCKITGDCMRWIFDPEKGRMASCPLLPYLVYDNDGNLVAPEELPILYYSLPYGELDSFIKHFED